MFKRSDRLASLIQNEVNKILLQDLYQFAPYFVTITLVKVTDDLQSAKIYYSVLGDASVLEAVKTLFEKAKTRIRFELGKRIQTRVVPYISFYYDDTPSKASKVEEVLEKINEQKQHRNNF